MLYDFKKIITSSINKYKLNKSRRMASQQQQQYQQQHQHQQYQGQQQQQQQQHTQPSYGNGNQNPHNQGGQGVSMQSINDDATRSYVTARTAATQSLAGTANGNDNATVGTNGGGGGGSITGGGSVMGNNTIMAQPTPAKHPSFYTTCGCIECYKPSRENLKYDYTYDDINGKKPAQAYPRIRERGEFYIDSFNGEQWSCSFGTAEKVCKKIRKKKPILYIRMDV
jgi:hypothetical protein